MGPVAVSNPCGLLCEGACHTCVHEVGRVRQKNESSMHTEDKWKGQKQGRPGRSSGRVGQR